MHLHTDFVCGISGSGISISVRVDGNGVYGITLIPLNSDKILVNVVMGT